MNVDSVNYKPINNSDYKTSYFEKYIISEDEVPLGINHFKTDTIFIDSITGKTIDVNNLLKSRNFQNKEIDSTSYIKSIVSEKKLNQGLIKPEKIKNRNEDWIVLVVIVCFYIYSVIKVLYNKRLFQIFKTTVSYRYLNQLIRDGDLLSEQISILLFGIYIFAISLFSYIVIQQLIPDISQLHHLHGITFYLIIFLFFLLFYLIKINIIRFLGWSFKLPNETYEYIVSELIFNELLGVILLPLNVIINYYPNDYSIYLGFIIISGFYISRLIRIINSAFSVSKFSIFHLFIYLCTVEILPILIIIKLIINYLSKS